MSTKDFDLEMYIQKFGPVQVQVDEWELTCPVCGKERKLVVNTAKHFWHCWVCEEYEPTWNGKRRAVKGAGGLVKLLELLEGCTRDQALKMAHGGRAVPAQTNEPLRMDVAQGGRDILRPIPAIDPPMYARPINGLLPYCEKRGIVAEDIQAFGLFYCDAGRYRDRLIFPVWEGDQLVYFQARAMWDPRPGENYTKTLNPPKSPDAASPSEVLMNLDTARHFPRVAITEGPIDCVHTGPSAVCTFGKKISVFQMLKLKKAGVRAVDLIWDGPDAKNPQGAWPEMKRAASLLSGIFDTRLVFLPWGDPGDYTRAEIDEFRARAEPSGHVSRLAAL